MQGYIQEYSINQLMMAIDPKDYIQCIYIYNETPPPPILKSNVQFACKLMYVNFLFIIHGSKMMMHITCVNMCIALCSINLFRY